jgi:hypothetical protein
MNNISVKLPNNVRTLSNRLSIIIGIGNLKKGFSTVNSVIPLTVETAITLKHANKLDFDIFIRQWTD